MPNLIILLVLRNLVDEEQGQDFDTLMEKLSFPLKMGKNRFSNLNAAKLVFAHDEAGIVAAMAAVFQQQPAQCYQRPATGLAGCRTGQVLFHFSA